MHDPSKVIGQTSLLTRNQVRYGEPGMKCRYCLFAAASIAAIFHLTAAFAATEITTVHLNLPSQSLEQSLRSIGKTTELNILIDRKLVAGVEASAVSGELSLDQAMSQLLRGTGLTYQFVSPNTVVLAARRANSTSTDAVPTTATLVRAFDESPLQLAAVTAEETKDTSAIRSKSEEKEIEQIIVFAEKRDENLQKVPLSINVVTGDELESQNLTDFTELQRMVPGFEAQETIQTDATIDIRGIKNVNSFFAIEPVVDTYWNGMSMTTTSAFGSLYDVEQIEFLRGPQGALQGRPAPGGAVLIATRRPRMDGDPNPNGKFRMRMTGDGDYQVEGGVSATLVPNKFAARFAGLINDDNGPSDYKNIFTGTPASLRTKSVRATLLWKPMDSFSATFFAEVNNRDVAESITLVGNGTHGAIDGYNATLNPYDFANYKRDARQAVLSMEWSIKRYLISSLTGYAANTNGNHNSLDLFDTIAPGLNSGMDQSFTSEQDRWTQEIRVSSPEGNRWEYMFGVYYLDASANTAQRLDFTGLIPNRLRITRGENAQEQMGVFTAHRFRLTDKLRWHAGLRWQQYDDFRASNTVQLLPAPVEIVGARLDPRRTEDSAPTWSTQLAYDFTKDVMGYISHQRSFRPSGKLATSAAVSDPTVFEFPDEVSDSVEIGMKATWLNGRLQTNINIYRQQFDGLIGDVSVIATDDSPDDSGPNGVWEGSPVDNPFGQYPTSIPALAEGVELEWISLPLDDWRVGGSLAYNKVNNLNGAIVPCSIADGMGGFIVPGPPALFATCDISGKAADIPRWSYSINTEYTGRNLQHVDWYVRSLFSYRDVKPTTLDTENPDIPAFALLDLSLGMRDRGARWDLTLWAKNILDKKGQTDRLAVGPETDFYNLVTLIQRRTIGLTLSLGF